MRVFRDFQILSLHSSFCFPTRERMRRLSAVIMAAYWFPLTAGRTTVGSFFMVEHGILNKRTFIALKVPGKYAFVSSGVGV